MRIDPSSRQYQPLTPGSSFPQTPGSHTSASPAFTTPTHALPRNAMESNYFPQVALEADDEYRRTPSFSYAHRDSTYQQARERYDAGDNLRPYEHITTPGSMQNSDPVAQHETQRYPSFPSPARSPIASDALRKGSLNHVDLDNPATPLPSVRNSSHHAIQETNPPLSTEQEPEKRAESHQFQPRASPVKLSSSPEPVAQPGLTSDQESKIAALPRYAPKSRVSPPKLVMRPIQIEEIDLKRSRCRNPLRREWEQKHQTDSRDALDQILRDFHSKLPSTSAADSSNKVGDTPDAARKRPPPDTLEDAEEVASHYNKRREVGVHGREESPIIGLRKFNNWIKSVLVGSFARGRDPMMDGRARPRGGRVLDLGCGKGGDLKKWEKVNPSAIVGADIAAVSIEQATARHRDNGNRFQADFFAFDCFSTPLVEAIPRALLEPLFDNVTLQFCMHYAWEDVQKARMMLDNVSRYLRPGGIFIGTIPDSVELRERLSESSTIQDRSFGNQYYKVAFDQVETFPPFGNRYTFFLEDAVENVPEYVVEFDVFEELASEVGLRCIYRKNFADIYADGQAHPEFGRLLERMKVRNRDGSLVIDEDMWLAATLYLGFAFEKM